MPVETNTDALPPLESKNNELYESLVNDELVTSAPVEACSLPLTAREIAARPIDILGFPSTDQFEFLLAPGETKPGETKPGETDQNTRRQPPMGQPPMGQPPAAQPPIGQPPMERQPQKADSEPPTEKGVKPKVVPSLEELMPRAKEKLKLKNEATSNEVKEKIRTHISELGAEEFSVRQNAEKLLKSIGLPAVREVAREFLVTDDAEIKRRCARILDANLDIDVSLNIQMYKNLRALSRLGLSAAEDEKALGEILKEPTQHVELKSLSHARLLQRELKLASRDAGNDAKRSIIHYLDRIEDAENIKPIVEHIGTNRVFAARYLARERPEESLRQLSLAMKDNQAVLKDDLFFDVASTALNNLQSTNPEAVKRWMMVAKGSGINIEKLTSRGVPEPK